MTKINAREVLHILRLFEVATLEDVPRNITYLKITELTQSITASFVFKNYNFYLLFDDNIADTNKQVGETLNIAYPGVKLKAIKNPRDTDHSYGMPYKAKTVYLAETNLEKQRLDVLLTKKYPDLSRSTIQKYITEGYATVNNEIVNISKKLILPTAKIKLNIPTKNNHLEKTLPILYEDENVLVINKPQGVLTHSKGALSDEFTVADFIKRFYADDLTEERPGIVPRLDRDTSGVIIGAKNAQTAKYLRKQFSDRNVKKTYLAILSGTPKQEKAVLDLPIARNMNNPSTFKVDANGKNAITKYEIIKHLPSNETLVKFNPVTGRTHQLRVHANYLNTPIKGDRVYGKSVKNERMYLHASELEITIPGGKRMTFTAETPKEFNE